MSDSLTKPIIFISYSHKDEPDQFLEPGEVRWLTYVRSFLEPAATNGLVEVWDDRRIDGGGLWRRDINEALERCTVCVFLVSRHSLSSQFICDIEMKRMIERHHARGAHLFPILISSTDLGIAPWLMALNLKPSNKTPLELYERGPRNKLMSELAAEIRIIVERATSEKTKSLSATKASATDQQSHTSRSAEVTFSSDRTTAERSAAPNKQEENWPEQDDQEESGRILFNLRFDLIRNALYHTDEQFFFSKLHQTIQVVIVLASTALFIATSFTFSSIFGTIVAGTVVTLATVDLVFDFSGRARLHSSLRQRYLGLLEQFERKSLTTQFAAQTQEAIYQLQGEEPPLNYCVEALAWNRARISMGLPTHESDLIAVNWWQRLLRHVIRFSPEHFRKIHSTT
jgi:TIR domain